MWEREVVYSVYSNSQNSQPEGLQASNRVARHCCLGKSHVNCFRANGWQPSTQTCIYTATPPADAAKHRWNVFHIKIGGGEHKCCPVSASLRRSDLKFLLVSHSFSAVWVAGRVAEGCRPKGHPLHGSEAKAVAGGWLGPDISDTSAPSNSSERSGIVKLMCWNANQQIQQQTSSWVHFRVLECGLVFHDIFIL